MPRDLYLKSYIFCLFSIKGKGKSGVDLKGISRVIKCFSIDIFTEGAGYCLGEYITWFCLPSLKSAWELVYPGQNRGVREILRSLG